MKKLLTLAVGVVMLAAFSLVAAQENKAKQKIQPTGVEMKQQATGEKKTNKASPQLMNAKVLEVNERAKTFTVMANAKKFTIDGKKLKSLPKIGDEVNLWADPSQMRTVCAVVECDMGWGSGPCIKCFDYGNL